MKRDRDRQDFIPGNRRYIDRRSNGAGTVGRYVVYVVLRDIDGR